MSKNPEFYGITKYKFDSKGFLHVYESVDLKGRNLQEIPFKFGFVDGNFFCKENNLKSLKNSPIRVTKNFNCSNNQLVSLEGSPSYVGKSFFCSNNNLTSLEYSPNFIGQSFYCCYNLLTSLVGCPKNINIDFYCSNNQLISLEGCPDFVGESFNVSKNKITKIDFFPKLKGDGVLGGDVDLSSNLIEDLKGLPADINLHDLNISRNKLISLEGCPQELSGEFNCSFNKLTDLEGMPSVMGGFCCAQNDNLLALPLNKKISIYGGVNLTDTLIFRIPKNFNIEAYIVSTKTKHKSALEFNKDNVDIAIKEKIKKSLYE